MDILSIFTGFKKNVCPMKFVELTLKNTTEYGSLELFH